MYCYSSGYKPITLACGSTAEFDVESGISYRCTSCYAVVGSIGMPKACKDAEDAQRAWEILQKVDK